MLISRLLMRKAVLALGFKPWSAFCSRRHKEGEELVARISGEKHFADVLKLVDSRRSELNIKSLGAFTKRAQNSFWKQEKENSQLALALTQTVRSLSQDARSIQELTYFLTILRNLKAQGFKSKEMADTRNSIIARCLDEIKKVQLDKQKAASLLALYFEIAFSRKTAEAKEVAEIIHRIAEAESANEPSKFTDKDISFFFHSLSHRADMLKPQVLTRSIFLKRIAKKVINFPAEEQASLLVNLSKTDVIDLNYEDIVIVRQLVQRVEKSIPQLGEEPIMELARCSNLSKLPGFFRVSQEIYKQIFFGINKSGITQFGYQKVLQVIGLLSDKISFHKANQVEKAKLFSLLQKFARECSSDSSKSRQYCRLVHALVRNRFFSDSQLDLLLDIMESNKLYFSVHLIYDLVMNGKITPAIKDLLIQFTQNPLSDEYLIKIGIAVCKSKAKYPQLQQPFKMLRDKIGKQLQTPASFTDFFNKFRFRRYNVSLYHFHQCFGDLFNALPNPLSTPQSTSQYCEVYLLYVSQGLKPTQETYYINEVSNKSLLKLIENEIYTNSLVTEQNPFLVRAIFSKLPSMLERREAAHVNAVINFLFKYNRLAVLGTLSPGIEERLFKTLNLLVSSLDILAEINLASSLFSMIDRFLNRSYKNYKIEHSYRALTGHLLDNIALLIKHKAKIIGTVVREGLRLDLVTKGMCDQMDLAALKVNFVERQRLMYIRDPQYVSVLTRIEPASLELVVSNHNLEETAVQAEKYIIQMIQKIPNPIILCHLLKIYNLKRSPTSKRIYSELLSNFLGRLLGFEGVDIIGLFRNALDKNVQSTKQYRVLCERAIQQFSTHIGSYSIYSHIELIRFIMSQKKIFPQKYYTDLVEYCYKSYISDAAMTLLLLRLAGSDYEITAVDAKYVFKMMVKSVHNAVFYFLMVEEKLTKEERTSFLQELNKKYRDSQPAGNKSLISKLQYLYLKKQYPSETAQLNIRQFSSDTITFRLRAKETISDIEKATNLKITELKYLGSNETPLYQIKDFIIYFSSCKKYGHSNEHRFNNRALALVFELKGKVVNIFQSFNRGQIYEQMHKSCFGLFSEEEYRRLAAASYDEGRRGKRSQAPRND